MTERVPAEGHGFHAIVEGTLDAVAVVARNGTIVYANPAAHDLARFPRGWLIGKIFTSILPPEEAARITEIRKARHAGLPVPSRYEIVGRNAEGAPVPLEIVVSPVVWEGAPADIVALREISERKRFEREMSRRQEILQAVATVAETLLRTPDWSEGIPSILESIARAIDIDRAFYWEASQDADGEIRTRRHLAWFDPSVGPPSSNPDLDIALPLREIGCQPWIERLKRGEILLDPPHAYPAPLRAVFDSRGIRSFVTVPILVGSKWSGVIVLSDCRRERTWESFEIDAMRVVADILGGVIGREAIDRDLRASEERYRTLVEEASDGIVMTDAHGRYIEANSKACEILGCAREELLRRGVGDFSLEEGRREARAIFDAVEGGQTVRAELSVLRSDGSIVPVEISSRKLPDGRHEGIIRDISERRRAEEELRRRDEILEAIAFAAARVPGSRRWREDMEAVLERLGRAIRVNRILLFENETDREGRVWARQDLGWINPEDAAAGASPAETVFSVDAPGFRAFADRLCTGEVLHGSADRFPEAIRSILERAGLGSVLIVPVLVEGQWWGTLGLGDRSEAREWSDVEIDALRVAADLLGALVRRRGVVEALRQSEEKYRGLVEGSGQAITLIDREGVFHFANARACAAVGIRPDEIAGKTMWDLFPRDHADRQAGSVRAVLESGVEAIHERQTVVQGEERWYESRIRPLIGPDGASEVALVIASDVTDRKQAQDQILTYRDRLRALASELAATEERERRRIAAELHDRIGQTLALSKMRLAGLREIRDPGELDAAIADMRALIDRTIGDTRSLIFDLSPPILHELGLDPALEWLLERIGKENRIAVAFTHDGTEKRLDSDARGLIFRAVRELLVNVVKHAAARRIVLSSRIEGDAIVLSVQDDGVGFSPEDVEAPGERASGFGLFSIRERISPLGGGLSIDSRPGAGTKATLTMPLVRAGGPAGGK